MKTRTNLFFFGLLIVDFVAVQRLEWHYNEQYAYGYIVPLLAAYLIYLRWEDRPPPLGGHPVLSVGILAGVMVALIPVRIVFEANPDWRAALWGHALLIWLAGIALLYAWGGGRWIRHFGAAWSILLLAVPWITRIEQPLVQNLMRGVAAVTVDMLNLFGIPALQEGNLIQLRSGLVGVEEACSGVRSMQSTLMASYFLGELFRFSVTTRGVLLVYGTVVAFGLNFVRTFLLTWLTSERGPRMMEHWHDSVGYFVSFGAFVVVLLTALLLNRLRGRSQKRVSGSVRVRRSPPVWLPAGAAVFLAAVGLAGWGWSQYWFFRNAPVGEASPPAMVAWDRVPHELRTEEIPPGVLSLLRFDEGEHRWWRPEPGERWDAYFFRWERGKIASFVGVHRPEICMPAAGFEYVRSGEPVVVEVGQRRIKLESNVFASSRGEVFAFYGVWEDRPDQAIPLAESGRDRLELAWKGLRIDGRSSMLVYVIGEPDLDQVRREVTLLLDRILMPTHPG